jgi:hypothetical protein
MAPTLARDKPGISASLATTVVSLLIDEPIVLVVRADPEPQQSFCALTCDYPELKTDACRPETPDLLQVQRWMTRILFEKLKVLVGEFPQFRR